MLQVPKMNEDETKTDEVKTDEVKPEVKPPEVTEAAPNLGIQPGDRVGYNWEHSYDPEDHSIKIAVNTVTGRTFRGTKEEFSKLING